MPWIRVTYILVILVFNGILHHQGAAQNDSLLFRYQELSIYGAKAETDKKEIYNAVHDLEEFKEQEDSPDCPVNYHFYYNPLSLVGDYYSYEAGEYGEYACGPPGSNLSVHTVNWRTLKPVALSDIFTPTSVLKALKRDSWVSEQMDASNVNSDSIRTFSQMIEILNQKTEATFTKNGFAIVRYDRDKGQVAVRLVGKKIAGYGHMQHLQLGLWLKPKKETESIFENRSHFFLGKFDNDLTK